jgi:hypothetical protein
MSIIDTSREELWRYFSKHIAPLIKSGHSESDIECSLKNTFGGKYKYIVRKYNDTIRVSAYTLGNGIIFFMAETKDGKDDYKFGEPSYEWRKVKV